MHDELAFYASPGRFTADITAPEIVEGLRTGELDITDIVANLLYHEAFAAEYSIELPKNRPNVANVRAAADLLAAIRTLDPRPLTERRPVERRLPTYCRQFSVLSTALLRMAGVPARSRCGFCPAPNARLGTGHFLDHWWVERWDRNRAGWVCIDTAIDEQLATALRLDFDPQDIPPGTYLSGAEAWQRCRRGDADPMMFGVPGIWGAGIIRGNVVRDLAALNKVELLPWDKWESWDESSIGEGPNDKLIDDVVQAVSSNNWRQCRAFYEGESVLQPLTS